MILLLVSLSFPASPGFVATPEGVEARLRSGTSVSFSAEGTRLGSDLLLRTIGVGRAGAMRMLPGVAPTLSDCAGSPCARFGWPGLTEEWTHTADGIEQTWIVAKRPDGPGDLELALSANVAATVHGAEARLGGLERGWRASQLRAWDAGGRDLPTRLVGRGAGLALTVDDRGAAYPIWVDPTYEEPDYTANGTTWFVAGGGDANGDGHVDLFMSSHTSSAGGAYFYPGTSDGFVEPGDATVFAPMYDAELLDAVPVDFAGDVNRDGYNDLIVAAPEQGGVNLYLGGPEISTTPLRTFPEFAYAPQGSGIGAWVAGAGDVNADGYADIVIGAPDYVETGSHAAVYLGGAEGPAEEGILLLGEHPGEADVGVFGHGAEGAGDVDGDGYDDVVITGYLFSIELYFGSADGVSDGDRAVTVVYQRASTIAGAGDVNADGYADVIVGEPFEEHSDIGRAEVYLGGAGGLESAPVWTRSGEEDHDEYGYAVAGAGDVNADGYADIITGSEQVPAVFLGGASGPSGRAVATFRTGGWSVATAGDVDRDGLDDVVVGGGRVYLASTFLNPTLASDYSPPALPPAEEAGCAVAGGEPNVALVFAPLLGLLATRRRRT